MASLVLTVIVLPFITSAPHSSTSAEPAAAGIPRETLHASHALLAFFVLTNADLLLARHFLPPTVAGIYAAGSIVTKVAFWLPQAVVVLAFPGLTDQRRPQVMRLGAIAILAISAVLVLVCASAPHIIVAVIGGSAYTALTSDVWWFALLGSLQALAQFLLYSRLAVQDRRAVLALWTAAAILALAVSAGPHSTVVDVARSAGSVLLVLCVVGILMSRREVTPASRPSDQDSPLRGHGPGAQPDE